MFRLPYLAAVYQSVMRYFVVDEAGTICRPVSGRSWTVMKRGIRESSVQSIPLARTDKRSPQQVLSLARIGTTIEVEVARSHHGWYQSAEEQTVIGSQCSQSNHDRPLSA